jgi:SAM-dependent methyltransferase
MNQPDLAYRARQEAQLAAYLDWVRSQPEAPDHELPTRLSTLCQPHQIARMEWLRHHCVGEILEVGCNFGLVLAWVGGHVGLDINQANIDLAWLLNPDKCFNRGDARALPYADDTFDTVMLPEILEHLSWPDGVRRAIAEACRVSRHLILITMPDGAPESPSPEAHSFKHQFLADAPVVKEILSMFPPKSKPHVERQDGFLLIHAYLKHD